MRLLLLSLVASYPLLTLLLPKASAGMAAPVLSEAERAQVRDVMHQVEYAAIKGQPEICSALSPLPLFENAPSADDWTSFCTAILNHDARGCDAVSAMLSPDLRSFCVASFPRPA